MAMQDELLKKKAGLPPPSTPVTHVSASGLRFKGSAGDLQKFLRGSQDNARARALTGPGPTSPASGTYSIDPTRETPRSPGPEFITRESHPNMGWQERLALNREIANDWRAGLTSRTQRSVAGLQARTDLRTTGMRETGLGARQVAEFGQRTSEQEALLDARRKEQEKLFGHQTSERLGAEKVATRENRRKRVFDAEQAGLLANRTAAIEALKYGGDETVASNLFNNPSWGFADFRGMNVPVKNTTRFRYTPPYFKQGTMLGPDNKPQSVFVPPGTLDVSGGGWSPIKGFNPGVNMGGDFTDEDLNNMSDTELNYLQARDALSQDELDKFYNQGLR